MNRDVENLRALMAISLATLAIGLFASFADMPLTQEQRQIMAGNALGAVVGWPWSDLIYFIWLGVYLIAHVLAFFVVRFARHAFLVAFALVSIMPAIGGMSVGSPWDSTAWALHMVASTFAIGLLFFAPGVQRRIARVRHEP